MLDGFMYDIPMVLVANPDLAGNHQQELADIMEDNHYCIKGDLE